MNQSLFSYNFARYWIFLNVSKPKKLSTLQTAIKKWLEEDDENVVKEIIESLKKKGFLEIDESGKVKYLENEE